jgi:hypothetical protein
VNLKLFVNNKELWDEFLLEIDSMINSCYKLLEQERDPINIHHAQGELRALRKLQKLRDKVNAK